MYILLTSTFSQFKKRSKDSWYLIVNPLLVGSTQEIRNLQKINDAVRITLVYLAQFPTSNWWVANAHFMSLVMTTRAVVWLALVYITWRFCLFSWCVLVMCIYVHIPETFFWPRYTPLTSRAAFCTSQKKQPRILSGYIFWKIFIVLETWLVKWINFFLFP